MHLWDAVTGELRCSYLGFDDKDEVSAAFSVAFSADGSQLAAGGNKLLRLFDVGKPGRECYVIKTHAKKHPGQPGAGLRPSRRAKSRHCRVLRSEASFSSVLGVRAKNWCASSGNCVRSLLQWSGFRFHGLKPHGSSEQSGLAAQQLSLKTPVAEMLLADA